MNNKQICKQLSSSLKDLKEQNLLRSIPDIDHGADLYLNFQGKKLLNLASNNYLGLSQAEVLKKAATTAIKHWGTSAAASRLVTGNFSLYSELEDAVAKFKAQEKALVIGSGYMANLCLMTSLARRKTLVFSDRLNHASIIDGIILSRAKHIRYHHNDVDHLQYLFKKHASCTQKILVTDTVFSMDGDLARLEEIVTLCKKFNVFIVIDEAHATGVFGKGRGVAHALGLEKEINIHMGTFSKALGSYGAYLAGAKECIDWITTTGRPFIYSTALPPSVIGANLAAIGFVSQNPGQAQKLLDMSKDLRVELHRLGFDLGESRSQIIPIILGDIETTLKAKEFLLTKGLFVAGIRPPTVPQNTARLRLSLRADLKKEHLQQIVRAFEELAREVL
ncbi:8-amino-7-oxononanoate synthase [Desulfovulcanus sp.]